MPNNSPDGNAFDLITYEIIDSDSQKEGQSKDATDVATPPTTPIASPEEQLRITVHSFVAQIEESLPQAKQLEIRYKQLLEKPAEKREEFNTKLGLLEDVTNLQAKSQKYANFVQSALELNASLKEDAKVIIVLNFSSAVTKLQKAIEDALGLSKKKAKEETGKAKKLEGKMPVTTGTESLLEVEKKTKGMSVKITGKEITGLKKNIILAMLEMYQDRDAVPLDKKELDEAYRNAIQMGGIKGHREPRRKLAHKLEQEYDWKINYEELYQALIDLYDLGIVFVFKYTYIYKPRNQTQEAKVPCFTPNTIRYMIENAGRNANFVWADRSIIKQNLHLLERDFEKVNTRKRQQEILETRKVQLTD